MSLAVFDTSLLDLKKGIRSVPCFFLKREICFFEN